MITPIETVIIRDTPFYVLSETYKPIPREDDFGPDIWIAAKARLLVPCECSEPSEYIRTLIGMNVMYQWVYTKVSYAIYNRKFCPEEGLLNGYHNDYLDDKIAGSYECEVETEDFGLSEADVEEFIKAHIPKKDMKQFQFRALMVTALVCAYGDLTDHFENEQEIDNLIDGQIDRIRLACNGNPTEDLICFEAENNWFYLDSETPVDPATLEPIEQ